MPNTEKLAMDLVYLCQLDIDAAIAYEQALSHIDHPVVRKRFQEFRDDHARHMTDIGQQIGDLGMNPPKRPVDAKGFLLAELMDLSSVRTLKDTLEAMDKNEKIINKIYSDASTGWPDLVPNALDTVRTGFQDEKKHLEFIEQCIEAKVWEHADAVK